MARKASQFLQLLLPASGEPIRSCREKQTNHAPCSSGSEEKWQGLLRARERINVKFWGKQLEIAR